MGLSFFLFKKLRRRRVDLFFYSKTYAEDESICFLFQKVTQKMSRSVFYFKKLRRRRVKLFFISKTYRSEEHTSELQSRFDLVCRLLLETKNIRVTDQSSL